MPYFHVLIKAELEGVEEICLSPDALHFVLLTCTNCRENISTAGEVSIDPDEHVQSGRAHFHFLSKCQFCRREVTVSILSPERGIEYCKDSSSEWVKFLSFDC